MISLKEYEALRARQEDLQRRAERQKGARDEILKQLQKDFGCSTLKEARAKLAKMQEKEELLKAEFVKKLDALKDKWKHLLTDE